MASGVVGIWVSSTSFLKSNISSTASDKKGGKFQYDISWIYQINIFSKHQNKVRPLLYILVHTTYHHPKIQQTIFLPPFISPTFPKSSLDLGLSFLSSFCVVEDFGLSCIHNWRLEFILYRWRLSCIAEGSASSCIQTDKTTVLSGFCGIECGAGSHGALPIHQCSDMVILPA